MGILPVYVSVYQCERGGCGNQKKASDLLELVLQTM